MGPGADAWPPNDISPGVHRGGGLPLARLPPQDRARRLPGASSANDVGRKCLDEGHARDGQPPPCRNSEEHQREDERPPHSDSPRLGFRMKTLADAALGMSVLAKTQADEPEADAGRDSDAEDYKPNSRSGDHVSTLTRRQSADSGVTRSRPCVHGARRR